MTKSPVSTLAPFLSPIVLWPAQSTNPENCTWDDPSVAYLLKDSEVERGLCSYWEQSLKGCLISCRSDMISSPLWPLTVSKMTSAIYSSPSPSSLCVAETYGRMMMLVAPIAQQLGVCYRYHTLLEKQLKGGIALSCPHTALWKAEVCY